MGNFIIVYVLLALVMTLTACGHAETELGDQLGCHLAGNNCNSQGAAGQMGATGPTGNTGPAGVSCSVVKLDTLVELHCGDQVVTLMPCVEPNEHSNKCGNK